MNSNVHGTDQYDTPFKKKKESRRKIHKKKIKTSGKGRTHKTKKKILEAAASTRKTWKKKKRNMLAISNTLFSTQDDGAWKVKLASGYKPDYCLCELHPSFCVGLLLHTLYYKNGVWLFGFSIIFVVVLFVLGSPHSEVLLLFS